MIQLLFNCPCGAHGECATIEPGVALNGFEQKIRDHLALCDDAKRMDTFTPSATVPPDGTHQVAWWQEQPR